MSRTLHNKPTSFKANHLRLPWWNTNRTKASSDEPDFYQNSQQSNYSQPQLQVQSQNQAQNNNHVHEQKVRFIKQKSVIHFKRKLTDSAPPLPTFMSESTLPVTSTPNLNPQPLTTGAVLPQPFGQSLLSQSLPTHRWYSKLKRSNSKSFPPAPPIISACIQKLSQDLTVQGLFRVCGDRSRVTTLRNAWESGGNLTELNNLIEEETPFNVASLLVHYLCLLPEPLIPTKFYDSFLKLDKKDETQNSLRYLTQTKRLIEKIPNEHLSVLQKLLELLSSVAGNSNKNKMTAKNLGIIFGPVIFRPPPEKESELDAEAILSQTCVTENLILMYSQIFEADPPPELNIVANSD
eukprot:TRINITY_DN15997_c0_g1_i1.p1 TRINITY_DN15997_c0_g1~~TRINITY_DN15997_c0_g1_i1.p1  ORF type:complete len:350 (+),score=68.72 TRINITY_DN15997_c0_g1_i1:43-1092(+)